MGSPTLGAQALAVHGLSILRLERYPQSYPQNFLQPIKNSHRIFLAKA